MDPNKSFDVFASPYAAIVDDVHGYRVLHVKNSHTFIQAAGYLKYNLGRKYSLGIVFRGQEQLYPDLTPALFRKQKDPNPNGPRARKIDNLVAEVISSRKVLRAVDNHVVEAALQHYGIRTRWLDAVDNVWIALWFACHSAIVTGQAGRYLHFEQRNAISNCPLLHGQFAYVILLGYEQSLPSIHPGHCKGKRSEMIDLRVALPSQFVRPHTQHAIVLKSLTKSGNTSVSFRSLICGVLRVNISDALSWLGDGLLLKTHSLFPPPKYDHGYHELLNNLEIEDPELGTISHIGA